MQHDELQYKGATKMNIYLFGCKAGKLTAAEAKRYEAAAAKHGVDFFHANMPGAGGTRWSAGPNTGDPVDRRRAESVAKELA